MTLSAADRATAGSHSTTARSARRRWLAAVPLHLVLIVFAAIFVYPILWTLMTAFKTPGEIAQTPWGLPGGLYFANFVEAWQRIQMGKLLTNSAIVSVTATVLSTLVALLAAWSIARSRNVFIAGARLVFLGAMFFPIDIAMVSLFIELRDLKFLNTYQGLIAPYMAFNLPLSILILTNAIKEVPVEILDSAKVDGANSWQMLWRIVMPIVWPSITAAAVLAFVGNWNEFLVALIATSNPKVQTLPVGIAGFINRTQPQYNLLFAGIVVSMIPMVIVFVALQRQFIAGVTGGAVK
jgi:raffinose/stachyose/melibiose transport system permease protein